MIYISKIFLIWVYRYYFDICGIGDLKNEIFTIDTYKKIPQDQVNLVFNNNDELDSDCAWKKYQIWNESVLYLYIVCVSHYCQKSYWCRLFVALTLRSIRNEYGPPPI